MEVLVLNAVAFVFNLVFPGAPGWIAQVFSKAIPAIISGVRALSEKAAPGADKKAATIEAVREFLDEELDDLPGWKELGEEKRDQLIDAMIELVYFVVKNESAAPAQPLPKPKFDLGKLIAKIGKKKA